MPYKIELRGSSYQATVNQGGRFRRSFKTRKEAQAWALEAEAARVRGQQPDMGDRATRDPGKPSTLGQLAQYVLDHRWKVKARGWHKTWMNVEALLRHLGSDTPIHKVGKFEIDTLVRKLKAEGNADATVNRKLAALSVMFNEALLLDLIDKRPRWKKLAEVGGRDQRISPEVEAKIVAFLTALGEHDQARLWVWCINTGMRLDEARQTRMSWLSNGNAVTIPASVAKGKKSRTIPLNAAARAILAQAEGKERVFADCAEGRFYDLLDAIRVHLGMKQDTPDWKGFVFHLTRHEFCSRLADRGVPAQTIQALAGHASLATSQRYIKVSSFATAASVALLDTPLHVALGSATGVPHPANNAVVDTSAL